MRNTTQYKHTPRTFRRASTKVMNYWGSNLQNVEKKMREMYESDGWSYKIIEKLIYFLKTGDISIFTEEELATIKILLQVDQAGAEALIVAYECEPLNYRKLFENNIKPHVFVALRLFKDVWPLYAAKYSLDISREIIEELCNTPIDMLKKNPSFRDVDLLIKDSDNWSISERYYYLAKQTCHSANYGIEWSTFIMNVLEKSGGKIVLDKAQGEHFLQIYRGLFPEIPERCYRIQKQAEISRMLFNLHGHPYTITSYEILTSHLKELYAWTAQSTVAEITRIAFSRLQEFIEQHNKKWDLLADTHDSYLVQCPLLDVKECKEKMQELMNQKLKSPVDGVEFSMRSECNIGFNWSGFKKETNPLGLQELKWL